MNLKIKQKVKKILPERIINFLKVHLRIFELNRLYKFDKKRFKYYSYGMNNHYTLNNLRSKITFHYHSIEKGLSNPNIRLGFGRRAFKELFFSMDKYIEMGYPTDDKRFQQGISVIEEYVELHQQKEFNVEKITSKLNEYSPYVINGFKKTGGFKNIKEEYLPDFNTINFEELALNRYSIRDYGINPIEDGDIANAIQIAIKTPSVCNRQANRVYRIKNKELLQKVFLLQGGLVTHGENLQELLLVTNNREYMSGPHERNQTYIDGGMFTMSLIYALTYHKIATCPLNADFSLKKEKTVRDLLGISYAEDLIAFISVGSFPDDYKIAKSPRDSFDDITIIK